MNNIFEQFKDEIEAKLFLNEDTKKGFGFVDIPEEIFDKLMEEEGDEGEALGKLIAGIVNEAISEENKEGVKSFVSQGPSPYKETLKDRQNPLDIQEGGDHYKKMKIQPIEFIQANNLGYEEANVIKYVCRHKVKNGVKDIDKAIHYLELLKENIYG